MGEWVTYYIDLAMEEGSKNDKQDICPTDVMVGQVAKSCEVLFSQPAIAAWNSLYFHLIVLEVLTFIFLQ